MPWSAYFCTLKIMKKLPLSATIITRNEENKIKQCIDNLNFCDEIIVVDSGSEDKTVTIATDAGAQVISQPWLGYGPQKQFAVEQATHDWVLCIDADEVVSKSLRQSIEQAFTSNPTVSGFSMPRCNHFLGRPLRHGEGYPDLSVRLFNRHKGKWSDDSVHEKVIVSGAVEQLTGDILHYSEDNLFSYIAKQNEYTSLQAQQLYERGKRNGVLKSIFSPAFRFIKFYLIRLGFLDGYPGLIHILIGCFNTFSKNVKLVELQITNKQP